jgi:hypothetical protein
VVTGWQSLASVPRRWLAALFGACALFAGGMALFSSDALHRLWGYYAVGAYLLAAVVLLAWRSARSVDLALLAALAGGLIAPLALLAHNEKWQPEVWVIGRAARLLVGHGTPYESQVVLATTHNPNLFNPYLPVMAVFGLPRALLGQGLLTDPRVWFGACFVILFATALAAAGAHDVVRWTALVTASPVIAFSLTVGGTDVPVLALVCLGLALLWQRPRALEAGLVFGIAAATKATAWPALVVAGIMLAVRDGGRAPSCSRWAWPTPGRRRPARCPATCWPTPGTPGTSPRCCCSPRPGSASRSGWCCPRRGPCRPPPGGSSSASPSCSLWRPPLGSVTFCTRSGCWPGSSPRIWAPGPFPAPSRCSPARRPPASTHPAPGRHAPGRHAPGRHVRGRHVRGGVAFQPPGSGVSGPTKAAESAQMLVLAVMPP